MISMKCWRDITALTHLHIKKLTYIISIDVFVFITIFRLAIPAFFRFTDVTELMWQSQYYIDGECRNKRERRK